MKEGGKKNTKRGSGGKQETNEESGEDLSSLFSSTRLWAQILELRRHNQTCVYEVFSSIVVLINRAR